MTWDSDLLEAARLEEAGLRGEKVRVSANGEVNLHGLVERVDYSKDRNPRYIIHFANGSELRCNQFDFQLTR
jgi:hypothetical protein